jgi:hypothetical protein
LIIPELISRIGNRWPAAANKAFVASVMRYLVVAHDVENLGAIYEPLQANSKKAEDNVVVRILRTGAHAARQHRQRVSDLVRQLFEHTPHDDEMIHVKEAVFGVKGGKPILSRTIYGNNL